MRAVILDATAQSGTTRRNLPVGYGVQWSAGIAHRRFRVEPEPDTPFRSVSCGV